MVILFYEYPFILYMKVETVGNYRCFSKKKTTKMSGVECYGKL